MLYERAEKLLEVAVSKLDDPPERQYVAEGEIAEDCQQVVVRMVRVFPGAPGREGDLVFGADGQPCWPRRSAEFEISVTRCAAPLGNAMHPTVDALDTSAKQILDDLDALLTITAEDLDLDCQGYVISGGRITGPTDMHSAVVTIQEEL